ncbi:NrdH-redoxin [Candidatus Roizmanbacteria bacterium CG22_combo_CG10-13_8_21_14_all_38_20]|uniref:NrdH-redoxin n=1 Tax=Candidatus Roizmanbacteria bacterium CG22_combo_CG10-13_8_21_14_all_38_20 TaxID=1974862 RepID=A0A2H0BVI9_9BACT|nr:MAG: NrdH-redoxin [Candidatus Roizmanbacteria bacterium CG22_combo_CG10-13_8_21_14_all_38_20]PJC32373.1 MAG: NrdH-redoxin [Candidatus Roizmanbacteria bacterium CG_4_9_14_0_2_um_filter_38_17]
MKIKLYGATWCQDCRRSKQYLDDKGIDYEYINLENSPDAVNEVLNINNGMQSIPTILFPNGIVLVEPSNEELQKAIDANKDFIIFRKTKN